MEERERERKELIFVREKKKLLHGYNSPPSSRLLSIHSGWETINTRAKGYTHTAVYLTRWKILLPCFDVFERKKERFLFKMERTALSWLALWLTISPAVVSFSLIYLRWWVESVGTCECVFIATALPNEKIITRTFCSLVVLPSRERQFKVKIEEKPPILWWFFARSFFFFLSALKELLGRRFMCISSQEQLVSRNGIIFFFSIRWMWEEEPPVRERRRRVTQLCGKSKQVKLFSEWSTVA